MEPWPLAVLGVVVIGLALLWRRERKLSQRSSRNMRQELERLGSEFDRRLQQLAWLEAALAAGEAMLLAVDPELRVSYANQAAVTQFGDPAERPGIFNYSGSLDLERLAQDAQGTEAVERILRIEQRAYKARAVRSGDGVGLELSDVSELQRLSRARQDFIANLSHELNTPLTSLRLLVDTLVAQAGRNPELVEELAGKMAVEVDALDQMAQEMLDLEAIETGRQIVRLVSVDLDELVEEIIERIRDQAERSGVELKLQVERGAQILADSEHAARAILNVLHNAVKFSPAGGRIELCSSRQDGDELIVLSIIDGGPGIPPEDLERIFERFYRVKHAPDSPGTGLGLAIAKHVMLAHAGRIWAENRPPPDRGAVFHLAFRAA